MRLIWRVIIGMLLIAPAHAQAQNAPTPRLLFSARDELTYGGGWSPDSRQVTAVVSSKTGSTAFAVEVATGKSRKLFESPDQNLRISRWSTSGNDLWFISGHEERGEIVYHLNRTTGAVTNLTHKFDWTRTPIWSPSDEKMAANLWYNEDTGKYELRMWDVQAGTMRLLADHFTEFDAILWTPDGRYLLFEAAVATALDPSPTGALYRANPATGDIKRLTDTLMNDYLRPVVSPDSTRVAYMWWNQRSEDATAEMRVVNIDTGAVQRLTEYDADHDLSWSFDSRYIAFGFGNLVALRSATGKSCDLGQKLVNPFPLSDRYDQVTWSPTDHSLFVRLRDKVYWMDMGTFNILPVYAGTASSLDAAWSPDGRFIALVTQGDRDSNKLYVVDTPPTSGGTAALDQCLAKSSG